MDRKELAQVLYRTSNLKGIFRLRSGAMSNQYFDKYRFEANPVVLRSTTEHMASLVPKHTEALAGLEMGGIPIVTMLSQVTGLPALFIRKQQKAYGTCKLAEGGEVAGRRLLIVEDVVTSGGQIIESVHELRHRDAIVTDVLCVIDRESGGRENLKKEGLTLHRLFTMAELQALARECMATESSDPCALVRGEQ